ncbi:unnamed protein product [Strongylus vulgaris]|uniref:SCP domain-containing protein n=1 Tax=Strongylus vulgaris TaxID=40348 RepID=A0A3P7LC99_STRVU|nr:unnamed protein product [Strongylus vulgaris]
MSCKFQEVEVFVAALSIRNAACQKQINQQTKYGCKNNEMTDAIRDLFLNFHNDARRRVAKGIEPNNVGWLNPAKNMYELVFVAALSIRNAACQKQINQQTKYGCKNNEMTDAIRDLFLNFHNDARRRVAKGIEPNNVGWLNPAKNMYELDPVIQHSKRREARGGEVGEGGGRTPPFQDFLDQMENLMVVLPKEIFL